MAGKGIPENSSVVMPRLYCRDGYSALYTRAQSLFRDLAMARADGSQRRPGHVIAE